METRAGVSIERGVRRGHPHRFQETRTLSKIRSSASLTSTCMLHEEENTPSSEINLLISYSRKRTTNALKPRLPNSYYLGLCRDYSLKKKKKEINFERRRSNRATNEEPEEKRRSARARERSVLSVCQLIGKAGWEGEGDTRRLI